MKNHNLFEQIGIPKHLMLLHQAVPIELENDCLYLAMSEPYNITAIDDFSAITGLRIEPVTFEPEQIIKMLENYTVEPGLEKNTADFKDIEVISDEIVIIKKPGFNNLNNSSVVDILEFILYQAVNNLASDIHIEPQEDHVRIRQRVDGMLRIMATFPLDIKLSLAARVKILAQLDIAEKRLPQDGRIKIKVDNQSIDLRVSTIPTIFGEKCVIRLLNKDNRITDLERLGFSKDNLAKFSKILKKPHGMVLLTGPTGSGKTTTLYAALKELSSPEKNVVSIEDPVEFTLPGVNQIQINPRAGLTFANGLRSILRQDPDIIMVGEIRDRETAEIAVQAATTGHLVLTTLHTGDAAGAIIRLIDMGIEPFMVASSVLGVVAQRLVRVLCPVCRIKDELTDEEKTFWGISNQSETLYRESGCEYCDYTGFRGRISISEVLPISRNMRKIINYKPAEDEITLQALKEGLIPLTKDGVHKALQGITSIKEIMRVSFEEG
ncbi:GspE/PulE family protein [Desulfolucanica intricata]|uniref:GspE/PulE family protein n=1 Tax=Desulfolucanica intricata TaxID=1285191 RepID=UPI00082B2BAA|nr:GspE/PulE family protein [Desulfolucanica intricata]